MHRLQSSQLQRKEALVNSAQNRQDHDAAQKDAFVLFQKFNFFQLTKVGKVGGKQKSHQSFTFRLSFSTLQNFTAFTFAVFLLLHHRKKRKTLSDNKNTADTSFCQ